MRETPVIDKIDEYTYLVTKAFISANIANTQLLNHDLLAAINFKRAEQFNFPHPQTFCRQILPIIMNKLKSAIERKLDKAVNICLIVDMWTSPMSLDFIALGARLMYADFNSELVIVGMEKLTNKHTAEHVQFYIEKMVNEYKFDKSKIKCNL